MARGGEDLVFDLPRLSRAPLGGGEAHALIAPVSALECEESWAIWYVDLGFWLYIIYTQLVQTEAPGA